VLGVVGAGRARGGEGSSNVWRRGSETGGRAGHTDTASSPSETALAMALLRERDSAQEGGGAGGRRRERETGERCIACSRLLAAQVHATAARPTCHCVGMALFITPACSAK